MTDLLTRDFPMARIDGLVVTESKTEVLVYDTAHHHIHHLNAISAVIWRLCDGTRSLADLARDAKSAARGAVSEMTVRLALGKLEDANLLDGPLAAGMRAVGSSRRTLLKRAAVAVAVAISANVSISAPNAAAQSGENPCSCGLTYERNRGCNECCSQCNGDGTTVLSIALGACFNPGRGDNDPSLTCNTN